MKAWAKINLTLDVLGKRADGYHELASVMQAVSLYDTLVIKKEKGAGIKLITDNPLLPVDENNLVYRAAQLICSKCKDRLAGGPGISIELKKNIPIAAGLAGGSSDAAATLLGLNELFGLKITDEQLFDMGRQLGADVPFCLMSGKGVGIGPSGGTAVARGAGERLTLLPRHPKTAIVLAHLPIEVSTREIFSFWDDKESENQTQAMVEAFSTGNINKISENLANDLTPIAAGLHPEILELITAFRDHKAIGVNMTGSGPTVFAYFSAHHAAFSAIKELQKQFPECEIFFTEPK